MPGYMSRKFIAYLLTVGLSFLAVWFGKISGSELATIVTVAIGSYMAGNAAEHFADNGKGGNAK